MKWKKFCRSVEIRDDLTFLGLIGSWLASRLFADVLFHDVSGCIGHNGAATSTTILSLPGPLKPIADEQMEEVGAVLENDSSTTTSLI
ncbi:hypothetical protein AVEN_260576-1 [Araneus ventricosus]|uniref:Uncharacterized protein n=1 Tax=Araneus ventricosus TaxID=182803 RepID=A0A4Y2M257_ARAVE|nr:hypothetical protein AVEN_260576-1 [Araneus ventricosus]